MLFWILAAIGLALATFISCLPLFRKKSGWTPVALALVFILPAGALMLYQNVGTPQALDMVRTATPRNAEHRANDTAEIDDLVTNLRSRLTEDKESLDGWVLLARTLKSMQRYPQALEALETAKRIAPNDPLVTVELVETQIYMSPQGRINDEMITMLKEALTADPDQQKALWLLGIAASQAGEDEAAISYWETLLLHLDPETTIAQSVNKQIAMAQGRLGLEPAESTSMMSTEPAATAEAPPVAQAVVPVETKVAAQVQIEEPAEPSEQAPPGSTWAGTKVQVSSASGIQGKIPPSAVLWVMIRTPGPAVGPPLGVRRVMNPSLPLEITISDQDSMMKERLISSQTELQLQARLSLSGAPQARSGDWETLPITVSLDSTETLELIIDQQVE